MESTAHAAQAVEIPQWIEHLPQSHHSTAVPAWSRLSIRKLTGRAHGRNAMTLLDGTTAIWPRTAERRYTADTRRSAALPYPRTPRQSGWPHARHAHTRPTPRRHQKTSD